jgi:hypothetical protein
MFQFSHLTFINHHSTPAMALSFIYPVLDPTGVYAFSWGGVYHAPSKMNSGKVL